MNVSSPIILFLPLIPARVLPSRYIKLFLENQGHAVAKEGFFVRMAGLPYSASESELIDFFRPVAK